MKCVFIVFQFIMLSAINIFAQSDSVFNLSLKQAQEYAIENNRTVKSSEIDFQIAKKKVWETTAIGLPQFTVDANYQHIFDVPKFSFPVSGFTQDELSFPSGRPAGFEQFESIGGIYQYVYQDPNGFPVAEQDNATFDFTLSQLIFSGEYLVGLQASKVYKELSSKTLVKTENDTRETVANSYYTVLVLEKSLQITRETYDVIAKSKFEMAEMYKEGFVSETDADRLTILESQLRNAVNTLEGQATVSKKLLMMQLGIDFSNNLTLTDSIQGLLVETDLKVINNLNFDVNSNVNYQLALTATALSGLSLKRERSKFLPSVAGFYRHQELAKEPALNFQPKDVVGVTVNFPIFTSGQRLSVVSQSRLEFEKSKLAQKDAEQGLIIQYETAKNDYITAYENYLTSENNFNLAKKIFDRSVLSFREGVLPSLDLTTIQREYLTTESEYISSIVTLLNAKAKLDNLLNQN